MKRFFSVVVFAVLAIQQIQSQSIYSFEGLGSLNHQGMPNNVAMGEVGIGTPTIWHINSQNPANLVFNTFSTFQLGIEVDRRNFAGDDISGSDVAGGLRFLGYAFPVMPGKWSSSISILPYSSVNYNTFSTQTIEGITGSADQVADNRGEGGLTNLTWSNGFKIKNIFQVGISATYTFGSINKTSTVSIAGTDLPFSVVTYEELESYADLNFLFGIAYSHQISDIQFLHFGATFAPRTPLSGSSELSLIRVSGTGTELERVEVGTEDIEFYLPQVFGIGLSYQRVNKYTLGLDFETNAWSSAGKSNDNYNTSTKISFGALYTPDHDNVNSYLKRITYSAGFNYQRLPYIVNDQSLIDFGINFGASLPVSGFSSLDLAFKTGRLGETSNGLIEETYYKIVLGATINDRWFIKRKYD